MGREVVPSDVKAKARSPELGEILVDVPLMDETVNPDLPVPENDIFAKVAPELLIERVMVFALSDVTVPQAKSSDVTVNAGKDAQVVVPVSFDPVESQHSLPLPMSEAPAAFDVVPVIHFAVPVEPKRDVVEQTLVVVKPVKEFTYPDWLKAVVLRSKFPQFFRVPVI